MRCNPLRWLLLGLLLVPVMTYIAVQFRYQHIQDDLTERSQQALQRAGLSWGGAAYVGRDGLLSGKALEDDDRLRAERVVSRVWGVYRLENRTNLVDREENYVWAAVLRDNKGGLKLTGFVPNEASRRSIRGIAKANFPHLKINDHMRYARGVPSRDIWMGGISFSLQQLARMKSGKAVLSGLELSLDGEARNFRSYRTIKSSLASRLPREVRLKHDGVRPPMVEDYRWKATSSGKKLVLGGYVPSEAERARIMASARKKFPDITVVDHMETARGQPENWIDAINVALSQLARMNTGEVSIAENAVKVAGVAENELLARDIDRAVRRTLPRNYRSMRRIRFLRPAIPRVSPFTTAVYLDDDLVVVDGYVPSNAKRLELTNALKARFKNRGLIDRTEIAAGAPKHWKTCMLIGAGGLGRLGNGQLKMSDRKLQISGSTRDEEVANSLAGDVRAASARKCETDVRVDYLAPPEPNLVWSADWTQKEIILSGDVPDADTKTDLLASARKLYPNARVVDQMKVVGGYSRNWRKVALNGLAMLASLRSGRVRLDNQNLFIGGEARDTSTASAIRTSLGQDLPGNYSGRDKLTVRSDAMIWAEKEAKRKAALEAQRRREAEERRRREEEERRRMELEKSRLNEEERLRAAQKARARWDEANRRRQALRQQINEQLRREAREAARRRKAEETARRLAALEARRLEEEKRRKAEEAWKRAQEEARRRKAEEARRRAEEEAKRAEQARIEREARRIACETSIRKIASEGTIRFRRAKADLSRDSFPTLDALAEAALVCPELTVEIEGHTDSDGTVERNLRLSQRRANAVRDYLISAGVDAARLKAVGFGEARPKVPNTSRANKAINRRIEFNVKLK